MLGMTHEVPADVDTIGRLTIALLSVDLASFTPRTEVMGDTAAAAVVERFSHLVREAAGACDGRVLKQIGDEFMLVFPVGAQAVACGLSIMSKAASEKQFPDVRLGAHAGDALYREGDYVGGTVNVAALVAAQAVGGQFLVTDAIRQDIAAETVITFKAPERRPLKGVGEEVELFEVAWSRPDRPVDPVCGVVIGWRRRRRNAQRARMK